MQRLGKNIGKYFGESLPLDRFTAAVQQAAIAHGWQTEHFLRTNTLELFALRRTRGTPAQRIYLSAGIHGDEPAGPLALLQLLEENHWPEATEIVLCPCLNPTGCAQNTRESAAGLDLNRDYLSAQSAEITAHIAWLQRQGLFDLTICLHEDWEAHGFYVYELNPDARPSLAPAIIERVRPVCPIDLSPEIEGRPAAGGIIRPSHDPLSRPQWPEAFYLLSHQTRLCYTVEAPSDFPLPTRVAALVASVQAALELPPKAS